jgi:hypothetical protein
MFEEFIKKMDAFMEESKKAQDAETSLYALVRNFRRDLSDPDMISGFDVIIKKMTGAIAGLSIFYMTDEQRDNLPPHLRGILYAAWSNITTKE